MPAHQNESQELKLAAPDEVIQGLLVLSSAQVLHLEAGDAVGGAVGVGECLLLAAVKGNVSITSEQGYALVNTGNVYLFRDREPYTIQSISDSSCMTIRLGGELVYRLLHKRLEQEEPTFAGGAPLVRKAIMSLLVLEKEQSQVNAETASSYAYNLLLELSHLPSVQPQESENTSWLVEAAVSIIQEEFPYLAGLDELAERLEISKAHLIRTFAKQMGISPGKYITRVRIEYAKLLLQERENSITYVAEASGFANSNYFAKVFRKETGLSPSEYLESAPERPKGKQKLGNMPPLW